MARKYWKGLEELKETPEFVKHKENEFPTQQTVEAFLSNDKLDETSTGRRDFLKFLGFSVAAATLAACEAPVTKAVPYVVKPENVTPGVATWYASTYYDGSSYASILVKTREGRPIFIKGNKDFGFTNGAVNPQIIASILGLYDSARLDGPTVKGKRASWINVDDRVSSSLKKAKSVTLLSNTVISPTIQKQIKEMAEAMKANGQSFSHIQYDAISYSAIRKANGENFGAPIIPSYDFSKAQTIISVGADFLGTWLLSSLYSQQYGLTRSPESKKMSKHFQFESFMSLSGSNADYRAMIRPSQEAAVLSYLIKGLNGNCSVPSVLENQVKLIADKALFSLKSSKKNALVVCGSNNKGLQLLTNQLNQLTGAYGTTIDLNNDVKLFMSEDAEVIKLASDVIAGKSPDVLMFLGVNPVYSLPNGEAFGRALKNVKTSISFAGFADETASLCEFVCPDNHALESWIDYMPTNNHYAIAQPTIRQLHDTASIIETFAVWAGKSIRLGKDSTIAYDLVQASYKERFPMGDFAYSTHNSCELLTSNPTTITAFKNGVITNLPSSSDLEIILYQKSAIGDGRQANNPWLQEMPDPITKATWDNYITMNPVEMKAQGFVTTYDQENGLNLATVTVNGIKVTLPVYPLPGQALKTIGIALGYGRGANGEAIGKAAFQTKEYGGYDLDEKGGLKPIGSNVFRFVSNNNGQLQFAVSGSLAKAEGIYSIAATQIHHTVMGRHSIVRETTLPIFTQKGKEAYNPAHKLQKLNNEGHHEDVPNSEFDLWDAHPVEKIGHRWGMTVDLSSCIGCGSCLIACQSENNVPVVGKDEVRRGREMHWLRIDRYFASDEEATVGQRKDKETFNYDNAEIAAENPKVIHMPMMCHHCNHAPCETVCPVAATTHSNEGLNQMTYNRCIGTRYCANNCPYKVRRFNWFNYPSYKKFTEINPAQDDLGRMVLNPDVTVRTRGVMEKCSFCVQRIQATKLVAKIESRVVNDGEFATACSDACPTSAIIVGDWNDIKSAVYSSSKNDRSYQALEEVGIKPNVWYKMKVRNEENDLLASLQVEKPVAHHGEEKGHH